MKKLVIVWVLILTIFSFSVCGFSGLGSGAGNDPYQITTCVQLQEMSDDLDADYKLMNDIDCSDTVNWNSGSGFNPVGNYTDPFLGILDGDGHLVEDLYIYRPDDYEVGLFGNINGSVMNIGMVDGNVTGQYYVGCLAGSNGGNIENLYVKCEVDGESGVGGLVGFNFNILYGVYSRSIVSGDNDVGGLVGSNHFYVVGTYSYSDITCNGGDCGGLVGRNRGEMIKNSFFVGNISNGYGITDNLTGASNVWYNYQENNTDLCSEDNIKECTYINDSIEFFYRKDNGIFPLEYYDEWQLYDSRLNDFPRLEWEGFGEQRNETIRTFDDMEGAGTYSDQFQITDCYQLQMMEENLTVSYKLMNDIDCSDLVDKELFCPSTLDWEDCEELGCGYDWSHCSEWAYSSKSSCESSGYDWTEESCYGMTGFRPIGRDDYYDSTLSFRGSLDGNGSIISNLFINAPYNHGTGLIGFANHGYVEKLGIVNSSVVGDAGVGCLIGIGINGSVGESFAHCNVTGEDFVGGLVGYSVGKYSGVYFSYSKGNVNGEDFVGGLVGVNGGNIINSYTYSNVNCTDTYCGGIAGRNSDWTNNGNISNSFFAGNILNGYGISDNLTGSRDVWYNMRPGNTDNCSEYGGCYVINDSEEFFYKKSDRIFNSEWVEVWDIFDSRLDDFPHLKWEGLGDQNNVVNDSFIGNGSGTSEDPYQINDCNQLQMINRDLEADYVLIDDIDCSSYEYTNPALCERIDSNQDMCVEMGCGWSSGYCYDDENWQINPGYSDEWGCEYYGYTWVNNTWCGQLGGFLPIGREDWHNGVTAGFNGTLDGQGHIILNLNITAWGIGSIGLFGYIDAGEVRDVGIVNSSILSDGYTGCMAGINGGSILSSYADCDIQSGYFIGGIAGYNGGILENVYSKGSYGCSWGNCTLEAGGIAGKNSGSINFSYSIADINCTMDKCGGLVVDDWQGNISNSFFAGNLSSGDGLINRTDDTNPDNLWYHNHSWNSDNCYGDGSLNCSVVNNHESLFYDSSLPVYVDWDFNSIWIEHADGFPTFEKVSKTYDFNLETTVFDEVINIRSVPNATIATQYGKVKWNNNINAYRADFDKHVTIEDKFVSINSSGLDVSMNSTAVLTLDMECDGFYSDHIFYTPFAIDSVDEVIYGGIFCPSNVCSDIACVNDTLTFTVSHFSGYAVGNNSNLTIYDSNMGVTYWSDTYDIDIYANYTNHSGVHIADGQCFVNVIYGNKTVYGEMTNDGLGHNFTVHDDDKLETGNYTILCNSSSHSTLIAYSSSDDFNVYVPEFGPIGLLIALVFVGLFVVKRRK